VHPHHLRPPHLNVNTFPPPGGDVINKFSTFIMVRGGSLQLRSSEMSF